MCKRILYVEDNPRNMLLVQRILAAEGHELLQAADGEMGWETAVTHHPDLILMDLRLPGDVSGFDLTRRLKQHPDLRHVPIVALTAWPEATASQMAANYGCDGCITKPIDVTEFVKQVAAFLA